MPKLRFVRGSDELDLKNITGESTKVYPVLGDVRVLPRGTKGGTEFTVTDEQWDMMQRTLPGEYFEVVEAGKADAKKGDGK